MVTTHRPGIPILSSARERLKTLLIHDEALRKRVRDAIDSVAGVSVDDLTFSISHDIVAIEGELPLEGGATPGAGRDRQRARGAWHREPPRRKVVVGKS